MISMNVWALTTWILVVCSALIVVAIACGLLVVWVRKRSLRAMDEASAPGFSIEELEGMRSSGHISDDEFRRLRRAMLGIVGKDAGGPAAATATEEIAPCDGDAIGPSQPCDEQGAQGEKNENGLSLPGEGDDEQEDEPRE